MVEVVHNQEGSYKIEISSIGGGKLFESQNFDSKSKAKDLLTKLQEKPVFERKTTIEGDFIINLKTADGLLIGQSQPYSSEAGMENGIKNLKKGLQIS